MPHFFYAIFDTFFFNSFSYWLFICHKINLPGALQIFFSLKSLILINNGLKKISNLSPVSATLKHLCLCDQNITKIENLNLPNLTELLLYRNKIREIENLQFCPRIRKLWLFQVILFHSSLFLFLMNAFILCNSCTKKIVITITISSI